MSDAPEFERRHRELRRMVERRLGTIIKGKSPATMVEACRYVLSAGGKRVRSTLLLLSCEAVGGRTALAVDAGAAVEVLHNFTLVHDDIMDNAPSRRGRPSVHMRWDVNNALLVGDVLIGFAYRTLLGTKGHGTRRLVDLFSTGVIDVCKGQALDLEYERRADVTLPQYFRMIEKKTGHLISLAAEVGGIIGGGTARQVESLRSYGHYLGRAFQLQDDLLDVTATRKKFGKSIGGDIVEGKKTFLLLRASELARGNDKRVIDRIMSRRDGRQHAGSAEERRMLVSSVTSIYRRYGIIEETRDHVVRNTQLAAAALAAFPRSRTTCMLRWFSEALMHRTS